MRFRFIEDHRAVFVVRVTCAVLEVSASGYHAWRRRAESARARGNRALVDAIRRIHADSRRSYGSPRVHATLQAEGSRVGRNRVARLMRRHGIRARCRRRFRTTTDSNHAFPLAPNLLARQFTAAAPNQVWLADITYVPTEEGWLYLAVVLDLFARKVVGWAMASTMPQELTLAALRMAINNRRPDPGLLHHADRGSQYAAHDYRRLLDEHGMICSMSRKGDCWDNAPMESFFGSLKTELEDDRPFPTRQAARTALFGFIEGFYNRQRLHSAIGYVTPNRKEQLAAAAYAVTRVHPTGGRSDAGQGRLRLGHGDRRDGEDLGELRQPDPAAGAASAGYGRGNPRRVGGPAADAGEAGAAVADGVGGAAPRFGHSP